MVEKFKTILNEIVSTKGQVYLFALTKMDDLTDKWSVVLAAPWLKEYDKASFNFILEIMQKYLTSEEMNSIARLGIFSKEEHLIDELMKFKGGSVIENQKINGNWVHLAYIIESNQHA